MADIFINEFKDVKFTKNQRKIAEYCSDHAYDIVRMTLSETAASAGVSEVSILNFVRKLGYKGFVDFRDSVVDRLAENASNSTSIDSSGLRSRMNKNLSDREDRSLLENHLVSVMTSTENSLLQNSPQTFQEAAELMMNARKTIVTGSRSMLGIASRFERGISYLLNDTCLLQEYFASTIHSLIRAGEGTVVFLICYSRFYKFDESICKAVKESGAKLILLTDTSVSPISNYADVLLVADSSSTSFFNSTVGAIAVLEYLITLIVEGSDKEVLDKLDADDKYTEEYRLK